MQFRKGEHFHMQLRSGTFQRRPLRKDLEDTQRRLGKREKEERPTELARGLAREIERELTRQLTGDLARACEKGELEREKQEIRLGFTLLLLRKNV
jgi:hypothetical protein